MSSSLKTFKEEEEDIMFTFVGSSHLDALVNNLEKTYFRTILVPGASIKGLKNPYSKTGIYNLLKEYSDSNKEDIYIFHFGQVDIEFGYYYNSVKNKRKLEFSLYFDLLIDEYESFLKSFGNIFIVCSIFPSVIQNIEHNFNVSFKDTYIPSEVFYSELDDSSVFQTPLYQSIYNDSYDTRIQMCKIFNNKLESMCQKNNFKYIDIWDEIVENNRPKSIYIPNSEFQHHLATALPRDVIVNKLIKVLEKW